MDFFLTLLGYAGIAGCILWLILFLRKKPKKRTLLCVLAALVVFVLDVTLPLSGFPKKSAETGSQSSTASVNTPPSGTRAFRAEFVGGHYTPGIDFPAGTYTITVLQGSGTIYYTEPSGAGKKYQVFAGKSGLPQQIELPLGEALSVSGVKIRMESSNAAPDEPSDRENPATQEVTFSPGSYTVGKDFAEGVYNVIAVSGKGLVSSDSEGAAIHNELDAAGADYQKEYHNLILDSATRLSIIGVTVKLVPSESPLQF